MIYSVPDESVLQKNLKTLPSSVEEKILRSPSPVSMEIKTSKTGHPVLIADGIALHSLIDPITESKRLLVGLKKEDEERVFLFFGAGIGYVVQESLKFKNLTAVWMEAEPAVIRYALSLFDYSEFLESGRLRILLAPILEDDLYAAFRGISGFPISFIPHRGSNQWKKDSYQELRLISEGFFHKKDVNISTLVRFEKIWTRNFIFNLPELARMQPIGSLFGLCKGKADILVCGAGPSLILSLEDIRTYRKKSDSHCGRYRVDGSLERRNRSRSVFFRGPSGSQYQVSGRI